MRRENRRIAAMSWGGCDIELPALKAARLPTKQCLESQNQPAQAAQQPTSQQQEQLSPQTYIIAQNPAVLARLMMENEQRSINPAAYTTPASVFNTLAVDVDETKTNNFTNINDIALKTTKLPAADLFKLDPIVNDNQTIVTTTTTKQTTKNIGDKQQQAYKSHTLGNNNAHRKTVLFKSNTLDKYELQAKHFSTMPLMNYVQQPYVIVQQQEIYAPVAALQAQRMAATTTSNYAGSLERHTANAQKCFALVMPTGHKCASLERNQRCLANRVQRSSSLERSNNLHGMQSGVHHSTSMSSSLERNFVNTYHAYRNQMNNTMDSKTLTEECNYGSTVAAQQPQQNLIMCQQQQHNNDDMQAKLLQQQKESDCDRKWLQQEEHYLRKRLSLITLSSENIEQRFGPTSLPENNNSAQFSYEQASRCSTPNSQPGTLKSSSSSIGAEAAPTIERSNDEAYLATTNVVKAIINLSQGVEKMHVNHYLELVKNVGIELRQLLASVDQMSHIFPAQAIKEVEMAHKVLAKDMHELVAAMRLAHQYSDTTLDNEYRKSMLSAALILAMDAKNLLDVVDSIRQRYRGIFVQQQQTKTKENTNGQSSQKYAQEDEQEATLFITEEDNVGVVSDLNNSQQLYSNSTAT